MLKTLVKVANRLDGLNLTKEADYLDSIIKKLAQVSQEDAHYMAASTRLAKEIMDFIVPPIQALDVHWGRSKKREEEIEIRERLGVLGFNINKATPAGVTVSYEGGDDYAPQAITVTFAHDIFSPESRAILTNKKGYKRPVFLRLNLNDASEASGGGSSIDISVKNILEGGSAHNVERAFWPAMEVFREQLYHEITHLDRSGSSPSPGAKGTIEYLMKPGEFLAHAHQVAVTYYHQYPREREVTWDALLSMRYPRKGTQDKVLNYYNLSQPDRIQKYQPLFNIAELDLSKVSTRFLETVNTYYKNIQATH